jgi:hypothetical protein
VARVLQASLQLGPLGCCALGEGVEPGQGGGFNLAHGGIEPLARGGLCRDARLVQHLLPHSQLGLGLRTDPVDLGRGA